ncbi:MAG TPA: DNA polymerase III subunit delta [Pyrinomonadaceae bacterium]|nr:DNA polymerase III subunit delta [Pyrinomonadaceae bacterium]
MPARTRKDLEQSLKKGQIEPVYFLYGAETYLRDGAAQQIVEAALTGTLLREFNDSSFDLLTDDIRDAIAAAEQLPLMSDRRVIVVKHLSKLEGRKKFDEEEDDDVSLAAQILMDYLSRPVATSVVIFTSDDIDKRRKYAKLLLASAAYEFKPLQQKDLPAWIRDYLRTLDTQIDQAALSVLTDTLASDLVTVKNELNKLATAALPSRRVTTELVEQLTRRSREHMNWDLTDSIVSRNRRQALRVLRHLLDDGVEPVLLTAIIAGTFRRMGLAKEMHVRGASAGDIFSEVRVPAFKQRDYLAMLNRIDANKMSQIIQRIAETDLAIKTSKATPRMQMEMLVCELMI